MKIELKEIPPLGHELPLFAPWYPPHRIPASPAGGGGAASSKSFDSSLPRRQAGLPRRQAGTGKPVVFSNDYKIAFLFVVLAAFSVFTLQGVEGVEESAAPQSDISTYLMSALPAKTDSFFRTETQTQETTLPYSTAFENSDELEIGTTLLKQEGKAGRLTQVYRVEFYQNQESDRLLLSRGQVEPQTEIILQGTKIIWRELETENGPIAYWRKIKVYATPYTAESAGKPLGSPGFGITATGTRAHFGTVAVDPKVIPLGTKMYIPGYGIGTAEDTGGAIKGNIIDLFYEGGNGWWNSGYVTVYLLD